MTDIFLFGDKTVAWFDLWSLEHISSGMSLGNLTALACSGLAKRNTGRPALACAPSGLIEKSWPFIVGLWLAYIWESVEFYLEAGYSGNEKVTFWFHGVEFWGNRLIADPICTLVGMLIVAHIPRLTWPARLFSLAWLAANILLVPHSMYLQHDILGW